MGKNKRRAGLTGARGSARAVPILKAQQAVVGSLLDKMQDGNEYGSIVDSLPEPNSNLAEEVRKAIAEIENIRQRPCITYLGNVLRPSQDCAVEATDDLPFAELVGSVPGNQKNVDVLLSTIGGSGQQVVRFVNCLRSRFENVDFIIPSLCMSAGTLFALSGDHIWMNPQAALGPIDPQVPTKDGRFVPAQALLLLVDELQKQGEAALQNQQSVPWTAVRIIDSIDKKELGDAITASLYSSNMASEFLYKYKFRHWNVRDTTQLPVTDEYRQSRASAVGSALASHDRWKSHGHSISREVLWNEIQLKIDHPDAELERAIRRVWALSYWLFDKMGLYKMLISQQYAYVKYPITQGG